MTPVKQPGKPEPYVVVDGGRRIYFLRPTPQDYDPLVVARVLAREPRFAGNFAYYGTYSVGQHSVLVSLCVEALGGNARQQLGGLVHDASEIVTGDLPSPVKREANGFQYIEALQNTAIEARYNVYLDDDLIRTADKIVLAGEVRMLVPKDQQEQFDVDPNWNRDHQPNWLNCLPWSTNEAIANFMDRYELLSDELEETGVGSERN